MHCLCGAPWAFHSNCVRWGSNHGGPVDPTWWTALGRGQSSKLQHLTISTGQEHCSINPHAAAVHSTCLPANRCEPSLAAIPADGNVSNRASSWLQKFWPETGVWHRNQYTTASCVGFCESPCRCSLRTVSLML